jgi:hypothetical protein
VPGYVGVQHSYQLSANLSVGMASPPDEGPDGQKLAHSTSRFEESLARPSCSYSSQRVSGHVFQPYHDIVALKYL